MKGPIDRSSDTDFCIRRLCRSILSSYSFIDRSCLLVLSSDFCIGRLCRSVSSSDSFIDQFCFLVLSSQICIQRLCRPVLSKKSLDRFFIVKFEIFFNLKVGSILVILNFFQTQRDRYWLQILAEIFVIEKPLPDSATPRLAQSGSRF